MQNMVCAKQDTRHIFYLLTELVHGREMLSFNIEMNRVEEKNLEPLDIMQKSLVRNTMNKLKDISKT